MEADFRAWLLPLQTGNFPGIAKFCKVESEEDAIRFGRLLRETR